MVAPTAKLSGGRTSFRICLVASGKERRRATFDFNPLRFTLALLIQSGLGDSDGTWRMSDQEALEVFFSYAHKDEDLRDELEVHLAILKRQGKIRPWHDRQIVGGQEWAGEIDANMEAADIILLLVSPAFIASDYCWDKEMERALKRHEMGQARVIPIILRPVDWSGAPFGKLQALPKGAKPVTTWVNRDEAFLDVAKGLGSVIADELGRHAARGTAPPRPSRRSPSAAVATPSRKTTITLLTMRGEGLLDELSSVFDSQAAATSLLERAEIPKARVRPFGQVTPIEFWESVCRQLEKGLTAGGLPALLRAAAEEFPYNPTFQRGLTLL